ncbi:hypothetical protein P3S67_018149 [Capsicum chacoense]
MGTFTLAARVEVTGIKTIASEEEASLPPAMGKKQKGLCLLNPCKTLGEFRLILFGRKPIKLFIGNSLSSLAKYGNSLFIGNNLSALAKKNWSCTIPEISSFGMKLLTFITMLGTGFYHDPQAGFYYSCNDGLYYKFESGTYVPIESSKSIAPTECRKDEVDADINMLGENVSQAVELLSTEFSEDHLEDTSCKLPENPPPPSECGIDSTYELEEGEWISDDWEVSADPVADVMDEENT